MLKLYDFNGAPSPRRAKMMLAEKGIAFEAIQIDITKGEQMGKAFRAINPRCTVPALVVEDGAVLTENASIAAYLDAAYPETPLLGVTPLEKAEIAKWNWRMESEGLAAVAEALRNGSEMMQDRALTGPRPVAQIPALGARGLERAAWFMEDLNTLLQDRKYVAGDAYSVADITATVTVDFARWIKVKPLETQTALLEWHERMKARKSYSV